MNGLEENREETIRILEHALKLRLPYVIDSNSGVSVRHFLEFIQGGSIRAVLKQNRGRYGSFTLGAPRITWVGRKHLARLKREERGQSWVVRLIHSIGGMSVC